MSYLLSEKTAFSNALFHGVAQPPAHYLGHAKFKQVARIIKHLRKEVKQHNPSLHIPTAWMTECLVFNCPAALFSGDSWQAIVVRVLEYIAQHTDASQYPQCPFTQLDGRTPLFPNHELYDEGDALQFSRSLLLYLQQEFMSEP